MIFYIELYILIPNISIYLNTYINYSNIDTTSLSRWYSCI